MKTKQQIIDDGEAGRPPALPTQIWLRFLDEIEQIAGISSKQLALATQMAARRST